MSLKKTFIIKEALPSGPTKSPGQSYGRMPGKRPGTTKQNKNDPQWSTPVKPQETGARAHPQVSSDEIAKAADVLSALDIRVDIEDRRDDGKFEGDFDSEAELQELTDGCYAVVTRDFYSDRVVIISKEQASNMKDAPVKIGGGSFDYARD